MNFFISINNVLSQKFFLFQKFLENLQFNLINSDRPPLCLEICPEIQNIKTENFEFYNFFEISSIYGNFIKERCRMS